MNIWAFNQPNDDANEFVYESVRKGFSRFGWSYADGLDLNVLEQKPWDAMSSDEIECHRKSRFLWLIKTDDWIVHINVPAWGTCTTAKVTGEYNFDTDRNDVGAEYTTTGDYRHRIPVDPDTVLEFDRNDPNVHPVISRRLKLQGAHWQIRYPDEYIITIENLRRQSFTSETGPDTNHYLRAEIVEHFSAITRTIQKNHPAKRLEALIARVFRQMDAVLSVEENGSRGGTDHGADLIVTYETGFPLASLRKQETLVIQVKSYEGDHSNLLAIDQLKTAIQHYKADMGLLITTGEPLSNLVAAAEALSKELEKPVEIVGGADVAKMFLKYGGETWFDI